MGGGERVGEASLQQTLDMIASLPPTGQAAPAGTVHDTDGGGGERASQVMADSLALTTRSPPVRLCEEATCVLPGDGNSEHAVVEMARCPLVCVVCARFLMSIIPARGRYSRYLSGSIRVTTRGQAYVLFP